MTKDPENTSLPIQAEDQDLLSTPKPFAADQMVTCDECLRANPPTRVNCLYCGSALPLNEAAISLQKPILRRLEKWELGYNNILFGSANANGSMAENDVTAAAEIVKISAADLRHIVEASTPLPIAHAATMEEARLVERRLASLGMKSLVVADADLGVSESGAFVVTSMELQPAGFSASAREGVTVRGSWTSINLIVLGRIVSRRVELQEHKSARSEDQILDSSEFFSDEAVFEIHFADHPKPLRINANNFDFSCLGSRKGLVAGQNMNTLIEVVRESAPQARVDDDYRRLRKLLEPVWPLSQQSVSSGWRRERPGKYSVGSVTIKDNERQFTRYSLLREYLRREGLLPV